MPSDIIVLVLSLKTAHERRTKIKARLDELKIPFEFIDGIDGRTTDVTKLPDVDPTRDCHLLKRKLTKGEVACALGHRMAYLRLVASSADYAVIFEDDAIIHSDISAFLAERAYQGARLLMLAHYLASVYKRGQKHLFSDYKLYRVSNSPVCACGYIVDRSTATRLIEANTPVHSVADWPLPPEELGITLVFPELVTHPSGDDDASLIGDRPREVSAPIPRRKRHVTDYFTKAYWSRKREKLTCDKIIYPQWLNKPDASRD